MAKKNKRRKKFWHEQDEPDFESLFPNSAAQHKNRHDNDIYTYDEDQSSIESPWEFDLGWDRKLTETTKKKTDGTPSYDTTYKEYKSGSVWRGYDFYKAQKLSYKYVQQMANALAAQHRITVQLGEHWKVDLKKKTLIYNPASLVYGTKSELLATLMHEIGKLRYGTHPDEVQSNYLAVYKTPAVETLSIFEDIRVDYWMLNSYPGASEIYESAIPSVDERVKEYRETSKLFRDVLIQQTVQVFQNVINGAQEHSKQTGADPALMIEMNLMQIFGERDINVVNEKLKQLKQEYEGKGTIYDYCGEMLRVMYDSDSSESTFDDIKQKVEQTETSITPVKNADSTQKVITILDKDVYPVIEDLLRDFTQDNERIRNAFPQMPQASREILSNSINSNFNAIQGKNGRVNTDEDGNSLVRGSGPDDNIVPKEWISGDYAPLKDSVMPEVKELIKKLTFIRREEMAQKHQDNQRRGTLNSKKLYKSATGNRRVFKKMLPNTNTVNSFAFSVLVDTSGSMAEGNRMVHTARALTIFGEVFKKMDIPFELIDFSSDARFIKEFDAPYDRTVEKRIGGLVRNPDGGTNLHTGLRKTKLEKQPQRNKVLIVLTDGGVGNPKSLDTEFFEPMSKRGVVSMGFGIECYEEMKDLCMGNGKNIESAHSLPLEFVDVIKRLIRKK